MLYVLFVFFRKMHNWRKRLLNKIRRSYYYHISKRRFIINSSVLLGKGFSIQSDISLTGILIKQHCQFRTDCNIIMRQGGKLTIGENCFFNNNCSVNCFSAIDIGNNNQFGEGVKMYDHNHNFREKGKLINEQGYSVGQIKIGNNCWFGSNVVILKGVEIGDNVIIGAGCVIHKSVPGDTMIVNKQSLQVIPYGNHS